MSARHVLTAVVVVVVATGCGVPTGAPAEAISTAEFPHPLAAPATPSSAPATGAPEPVAAPGRIFLVGADDRVAPAERNARGGPATRRLEQLLDALAAGPTADERGRQLSTALPPEVELSVTDLTGGTATIDLSEATDVPSGAASRLAVAQIVLTATSLIEVDGVLLTVEGTPVDAPLASGQLTSAPLRGSDYAPYLSGPP